MSSRALPRFYYHDPAVVYEKIEAKQMGCKACLHHRVVFDRVMCGHESNEKQRGVPYVGFRCRWFNDRR